MANIVGMTPLIAAAYFDHTVVVKVLLAAGADRHAQMTDGRTALGAATAKGFTNTVALLSGAGGAAGGSSSTATAPPAGVTVDDWVRGMPVSELKTQLDQRGVDHSQCVERGDLEALLKRCELEALMKRLSLADPSDTTRYAPQVVHCIR